jgi:general stress protein 26
MQTDRRKLILAAAMAGFDNAISMSGEEPDQRLYRTATPEVILSATRALMRVDTIGTLITVDATGQPRARSILVSAPDDDLTIWMGTRKGSRKLEQIAANHRATIYFADDSQSAYLSLMGEVRAVADPATVALKNPYKGEALAKFFPTFPSDFVLLSFKPHYLEIATKAVPSRPDTWQPQGIAI